MTREHRFYFTAMVFLFPTMANACQVDRFNFVLGSDSNSHMSVKDSESCKFGFKASARTHVASFGVAQPPQHGTLTQADETHWMYHPARGYTGPDAVVVKVSGENMGNRHVSSGDTNITWAIDVAP